MYISNFHILFANIDKFLLTYQGLRLLSQKVAMILKLIQIFLKNAVAKVLIDYTTPCHSPHSSDCVICGLTFAYVNEVVRWHSYSGNLAKQ